ncbi:LysR family transcriptional regulator [Enterobacter soli]|uniref:LysR family transcriptional regulator n=1 Tax=Enterobacter soli TaxID=885040 RepID=A0AAW8H6X9_9ENTR|nr:LysR family transcriptional regulator [Enterobacter soli]MDQ2255675.1 LysR family transcriptional regulator [Enterobacter soli]MDQ2336001.1 LysR family transcriptional regulator [Enterobacter soli]HED3854930.1 LysR family transcriptional regulator [Enterobacter soli]HEE9787260.1 LysR family transcriptional regulator [Enterobacter soli]
MHRSGLTELEVVLAVVRRGGFRAAAQELGMSATAVSNAVAGLESRLQTRLFNRTTRSVALTDAGQRFVARVGPALQEIRQASEEIHSDNDDPAGTLRLNVPNNIGPLFLDNLLIAYMQRYPKMRVETVSEARMIDIVAEGYDAGIRLAESVPQDMVAVALTPDIRQLIVATPDHFTRYGIPQTPDDLLHHQGIGMRMSHGGLYRWELERRGEQYALAVPPRFATSDLFASIRAVKAGLGVGFLPELYIRQELESGELVSVLEDWTQPFAGLRLYYPGHRHVPPGLRAFVALVRERGIIPG